MGKGKCASNGKKNKQSLKKKESNLKDDCTENGCGLINERRWENVATVLDQTCLLFLRRLSEREEASLANLFFFPSQSGRFYSSIVTIQSLQSLANQL